MTVRVPRTRGADRHLATAFLRNARGFHAASVAAHENNGHRSGHFLAIAVELALKAYLLHRGISDEWNRVHVRHDLVKVVRCARRAELTSIPVGLMKIAERLGQPYQSGAFSTTSADYVGTEDWDDFAATTRALIVTVEAAIRRDPPIGSGGGAGEGGP